MERDTAGGGAMKTLSAALLVVVVVTGGCGEAGPRNLSSLVQRDGVYLDPDQFRPYTGPVVSYHRDPPDAVEMTAELVDGLLHGPYVRYYPTGEVLTRGRYERGRWEGDFETLYADGSLWMRGGYSGGELDGPFIAYDEDGDVVEEGAYADGEPCGVWLMDGERVEHAECPE